MTVTIEVTGITGTVNASHCPFFFGAALFSRAAFQPDRRSDELQRPHDLALTVTVYHLSILLRVRLGVTVTQACQASS